MIDLQNQNKTQINKTNDILIVDDNKETRKTLSDILSTEYTLYKASNGNEALIYLNKNNLTLKLVVLDLMMPKINGFKFLSLIRNYTLEIPILVLSAKIDTLSRTKAIKLGAWVYISKPFEFNFLKTQVKSLIKIKRMIDCKTSYAQFCENISYKLQKEIIKLKIRQKKIETHFKNLEKDNKNPIQNPIQEIIKSQNKIVKQIQDEIKQLDKMIDIHLNNDKTELVHEKFTFLKNQLEKLLEVTQQYKLYQSLLN